MRIALNCLLILVAAAAGLGIGFALRARNMAAVGSSPTETVESSTSISKATSNVPLKPGISIRYNDDSPLATKLERDLSMSSGVVKWLYWLEALEKAAPSDFPRLARLAQGNSTALRFVAARWVELAPRHLFDTIVTASKNGADLPLDQLSNVLFEEWPKRDPDAVIAALNESEFGPRGQWRMRVASRIVDTDPELGLRLLSEWNIENYGPSMSGIAKWAAADPKHAAEFTMAHPAGYASRYTMETIGKEWAKKDPARALEFAASKPGDLTATLGTAVMKQWANQDLNAAGKWLAESDPQTRNRLNSAFVEVWAKQDAAGALGWCESNLTGSSLAEAVGSVMKGAAAKDVAKAAGLVSGMDPSRARAEAAVSVAQKWMPDFSANGTVKPEMIAWLNSLDPDSVKRVLDKIHWRWSDCDPESMSAFIASCDSDEVPSHAYNGLARSMARKNPLQALQWASQLPGDRSLNAGGDAFREWRQSQPQTALKWLQELPTTDPRRQSFFRDALRDMAWDSHAAEHFAQMTPTDRAAARNIVQNMHLPEDRRSRLLGMLPK